MLPNDPTGTGPDVPHDTPHGDCTNLPAIIDALWEEIARLRAGPLPTVDAVVRDQLERESGFLRECVYTLGTKLLSTELALAAANERLEESAALFRGLMTEFDGVEEGAKAIRKENGPLRLHLTEALTALAGIDDTMKPAKFSDAEIVRIRASLKIQPPPVPDRRPVAADWPF